MKTKTVVVDPNLSKELKDLYPRTRKRIQITRQYLSPQKKVLDIGCSDTVRFYGKDISKKNYYAIEPNKPATNWLKRNGYNAIQGSIYETNKLVKGKKFDIVLCMGVLEHLQDIGLAFQQMKNAMTKNGKLLFSVQNCYKPERYFTIEPQTEDDYHYMYYSEGRTGNIIKDNGLEIEKTYYIPNEKINKLQTFFNKNRCDTLLFVCKKKR